MPGGRMEEVVVKRIEQEETIDRDMPARSEEREKYVLEIFGPKDRVDQIYIEYVRHRPGVYVMRTITLSFMYKAGIDLEIKITETRRTILGTGISFEARFSIPPPVVAKTGTPWTGFARAANDGLINEKNLAIAVDMFLNRLIEYVASLTREDRSVDRAKRTPLTYLYWWEEDE